MNDNRSVAMISEPEFINLQPDALNPGISRCEIKVLYLGENRNGSFIDKNTAIQMANSLPGCPIVGAYNEGKEDFGDHGEVITIEDGEIRFSCKTVPYGFVSPDASVWFQKFRDTDPFGNDTEREYMMTTGYLWTKQYKEALQVIEEGKGQSMELDPETLDGHWATNSKTGIDFFIINDAIFTKLCILGDDVEPCFEGASVTAPQVSKNFSKQEFSNTLYSMMKELKFALQGKGGSDMPDQLSQQEVLADNDSEVTGKASFTAGEEVIDETSEFACGGGIKKKNYAEPEDKKKEDEDPKQEEQTEETPEDEKKKEVAKSEKKEETPAEEGEKKKEVTEAEKKKTKCALDYEAEIETLQKEIEELRAFKLSVENEKKDALINKYHMLSDEDKADVIANKEKYSMDEIESKLALIYVNKNVDFSTLTGEKEDFDDSSSEEEVSMTFSLDDEAAGFVPSLVEVLRQAKEN